LTKANFFDNIILGGDKKMNMRIKELRKSLNLNQTEFGKKLGITTTAVSKIEKKTNNLSEQNIKAICREFNVNEEWLRTGKGEMFKQEKNYSLDEFLRKRNATSLEIEFMKIYFSLEENIRKKIISDFKKAVLEEEFANPKISDNVSDEISVTEENQKETKEILPEHKNMSTGEITKQMASLENLLEKRQKEELLALQNTKKA